MAGMVLTGRAKNDWCSSQLRPGCYAPWRSPRPAWRLRCHAVADSLERAGDQLLAFTRVRRGQWKSARTPHAIERLHEESNHSIKTQTVLPSAETAAVLFWALIASGQITMRKINGWPSIAQPIAKSTTDLAA